MERIISPREVSELGAIKQSDLVAYDMVVNAAEAARQALEDATEAERVIREKRQVELDQAFIGARLVVSGTMREFWADTDTERQSSLQGLKTLHSWLFVTQEIEVMEREVEILGVREFDEEHLRPEPFKDTFLVALKFGGAESHEGGMALLRLGPTVNDSVFSELTVDHVISLPFQTELIHDSL